MTKLNEWLFTGFFITGMWMALTSILGKSNNIGISEWKLVTWFPIVIISMFGIYAVVMILYRVFTFNNCELAAIELQKQIKEATIDLTSKGITLFVKPQKS